MNKNFFTCIRINATIIIFGGAIWKTFEVRNKTTGLTIIIPLNIILNILTSLIRKFLRERNSYKLKINRGA